MHYHFGKYELRTDSHELLREGQPVEIEPKVFDLIQYFLCHPGQLISHDDLIQSVWQGVIVSDSAISARISAARSALGDDGKTQSMIKTHPKRGFSFVAEVERRFDAMKSASPETPVDGSKEHHQTIRFCTSKDGTHIAYAQAGEGYPLVRVGHWLTHLEHDWNSPVWRPFLSKLCNHYALTRYDQRGNGLSDWDVDDLSLERFCEDLEAVVDAAGLEKFALYGTSQGCPVAIEFARRYPDKVSHLILHGGYQVGRFLRASEEEREQGRAMLTFIRQGWGQPNGPFLQAFASIFIPDGTKKQMESLTELQRISTSPDNAARIRETVDLFDVSEHVGEISIPALVIHARNDGVQPLSEGKKLAAAVPGAQFLMLDSRNHVLLEHEPGWQIFFEKVDAFIASNQCAPRS
jgi:pimeloyl-ACP methyl ester carboxylesterase/DNA-binding winged helix-turn-helix (wHTH) protein